MVFGVHEAVLRPHLRMYVFDLTQQVGLIGVALALLGLVWLARRPRLALLVGTAWLVAFVFAFTYNVGDAHVFFLPSHEMVVLAAAAGVAAIEALARRASPRATVPLQLACALVALAYPGWRAWQTYPAVDRHDDRRPVRWLSAFTAGLDRRDLLLADVNWQLGNGFDYYLRQLHPELNAVRATDAVLTLPFLVRDNLAAGREVLATPIARDLARAAYGDLFRFDRDTRVDDRQMSERVRALAPGTLYVLAVLTPYRDLPFDRDDLARTSAWLTGGAAVLGREPSYSVVAGTVGRRPAFDRRSDAPWHARLTLGGVPIEIRMDGWLPTDTIRRAGFGQVIAGRAHVLVVERGVSLVALSPAGTPVLSTYASGLYAPMPRYRVSLAAPLPGPVPERACATLSILPAARHATPSDPPAVPGAGAGRGAPRGGRAARLGGGDAGCGGSTALRHGQGLPGGLHPHLRGRSAPQEDGRTGTGRHSQARAHALDLYGS